MHQNLPLQDGDKFIDQKGRLQKVGGSILANGGVFVLPEREKIYNPDICWTTRGDWFRRSDAMEMTGACGEPIPINEAYSKIRIQRRP